MNINNNQIKKTNPLKLTGVRLKSRITMNSIYISAGVSLGLEDNNFRYLKVLFCEIFFPFD